MQWAENRAGKGKLPELQAVPTADQAGPRKSNTGSPSTKTTSPAPPASTRVWVDDVNGDGKLDLLVGDSVTLISPAEGLSEEEFKTKQAQWQEAFSKASQELNATFKDEKERDEAQQHSEPLQRAQPVHEGGPNRLRLALLAEVSVLPAAKIV